MLHEFSFQQTLAQERLLLEDFLKEDGSLKAVVEVEHAHSVFFMSRNLLMLIGLETVNDVEDMSLASFLGNDEDQLQRFKKVIDITSELEQKSIFYQPIRSRDRRLNVMLACTAPLFVTIYDDAPRYVLVIFEKSQPLFEELCGPKPPCQMISCTSCKACDVALP